MKRAHGDALHTHCEELVAATPALLEEAAEAVLRTYSILRKSYNPDVPLEMQYRQQAGFSTMIDTFLQKHYPEHFQGLLVTHNAELAALDEKIAALKQAI